jgi:hypothetical protein
VDVLYPQLPQTLDHKLGHVFPIGNLGRFQDHFQAVPLLVGGGGHAFGLQGTVHQLGDRLGITLFCQV